MEEQNSAEYNLIEKAEIAFEYVSRITDEIKNQIHLPQRSTKKSAGYDFINPEKVVIEPHQIKIVKTGVKSKFPEFIALELYNRSSNPIKKHLVLANGVGIVDADYYNNSDNEGEIGFMFMNISDEPVTLEVGDKLGQGIFKPFATVSEEAEITSERASGWGSTGV